MSNTSIDITSATLAAEARAYARQNGNDVGSRGRLSQEQFSNYFISQPARTRQVARTLGLVVGQRGRVSAQMANVVAAAVR